MSPLTDEERQKALDEDKALAGTADGFTFTPGFDSHSELTDKFSGAGIADTIVLLNKGIEEENKAVMAAAGVALVFDSVGLILNPLGSLAAAGVGWLIDHLFFLREPLDLLMGDNQAIAAQTKRIQAEAAEYTDRIAPDHKAALEKIQGWQGAAADAFRADMERVRDELTGVGEALKGLASIMSKMGACVTAFRSVVRDIIAMVIGGLIGGAIAAAAMMPFTFGTSIAVFITSAIGVALSALAKITSLIGKLTSLLTKNAANVSKVTSKVDDIAAAGGRQHAPVPKPTPKPGPPPAKPVDPPAVKPADNAPTAPPKPPDPPPGKPVDPPPVKPADPAPTTPAGGAPKPPDPPPVKPADPAPSGGPTTPSGSPPPPPPPPTRPPPPPPPTRPPPPPPTSAPPKPPANKPPINPTKEQMAKLPIKQRMEALTMVADQTLAKSLAKNLGVSQAHAFQIVRVLRNIEGVAAPGGSVTIGGKSYSTGDLFHASHELWKEFGGLAGGDSKKEEPNK